MGMKRAVTLLLLGLALVVLAAAGYWLKRPAAAQTVTCIDPLAGCRFTHRGTPVSLRFSAPPSALEAFELRVSVPEAKKISVQFQMNGMDMGFNRYDLRPSGKQTFSAKVMLPVCISGRHDWTAYFDIDGSRYALPFSTG